MRVTLGRLAHGIRVYRRMVDNTDIIQTSPFEFEEQGEGPVLLFLHGLFGDVSNWRPMMEAMAPYYHVVALRYPFFDDKNLSSIQGLTQYTIDFINTQNFDVVNLCGNSIGGQIALDFALKFSDRVDKMILTGSAGLWEAQPNGELPKATREFIRQQAEKIFYDADKHLNDEMIEKLYELLKSRTFARTLIRMARATQSYTLDEQLHLIKAPSLLIWGENDEITPPDVAQTFHDKIPGSQLLFLPECGHAPPLEQPGKFIDEMKKFLCG